MSILNDKKKRSLMVESIVTETKLRVDVPLMIINLALND